MAPATIFPLMQLAILATLATGDPTPTLWPEQFHSVLVMNSSGEIQIVDLWYDYPKGRNFNIIHYQLGKVFYDLEWNNGTSFFYTLEGEKECEAVEVGIGILRPDWLAGAEYLGRREVAGFVCDVWEKAEFIWYYEDVVTKRPVYWRFYTGRTALVMSFEVGAVLDDSQWQAPGYCFDREGRVGGGGDGGLRGVFGDKTLGGRASSSFSSFF